MPLFKRTLSEFVFRRFVLKHHSSNLLVDLNLEAKKDTLDYIKANMVDAPYFEKHPQLIKFALSQISEEGLHLEFAEVGLEIRVHRVLRNRSTSCRSCLEEPHL